MNLHSPVLIVLDSLEYIEKETELKKPLLDICVPEFYYTYYENKYVKFFHSLPVVGNFLSHIAYWSISFNAARKIFFKWKKIKNKIFINPIVAIFYCFFVSLLNRKESISIAGFLFVDKKNKFYFNVRKKIVLFCYKNVSRIIVYSKNEVKIYSDWFPTLSAKFIFVEYGRDYEIFEENVFLSAEPYIASGGMHNRDFKTLVDAFTLVGKTYPYLKCKIATRPHACSLYEEVGNVDVLYNVRIDTFGSFLEKSIFVVIPLDNTLLSAGHMSLLEAMYRGKIILITDIPAIRDYVSDKEVFFYKPENPTDLARMLEYIYINLSNKDVFQKGIKAQSFYSLNYTFSNLLYRIVKLQINGADK